MQLTKIPVGWTSITLMEISHEETLHHHLKSVWLLVLTESISQLSVYHHISIASDGRCEVCVERDIEGIMMRVYPCWHFRTEV